MGQMIPQLPQMMVTIQTPNGPILQPVYPVAQFPEQFQPCVVTAPEQHPVQQAELHRKKFASRSTSFDGSERSVSDSGDNKYFTSSLQRHSSEISRDGYGSDTFVDNRYASMDLRSILCSSSSSISCIPCIPNRSRFIL
jgi:hypothetical protein